MTYYLCHVQNKMKPKFEATTFIRRFGTQLLVNEVSFGVPLPIQKQPSVYLQGSLLIIH